MIGKQVILILLGAVSLLLAACTKSSSDKTQNYDKFFGQAVSADCDADFDASLEPWPPVSGTPVKISTGGILDDGCISVNGQAVVYQVTSSSGTSEWKPMRQTPYPDDPDMFDFVTNESLPKGEVTLKFKVAGYFSEPWSSESWKIVVK